MTNKTWITIVVIIIVVLGGVAIYNFTRTPDVDVQSNRDQALREEAERSDVTVTAKHQYKDGTHTYLGSFDIPSPCHAYNAEVVDHEDSTEIALSYSETDEVCAQVITEREFKVSFEAPEEEPVYMTLNGEVVDINQFDVPADANIDEIDIFNKG